MMTKFKLRYVFGVLVLSVILSGVLSGRAGAIDNGSIKSKAALEGVYKCFDSSAFKPSWTLTVGSDSNVNWSGFIQGVGVGDGVVRLPYGFTPAPDNHLDCSQVIVGFGNKSDDLEAGLFPTEARKSLNGAKNTLEKVGYQATSNGEKSSATSEVVYELSINDSDCFSNGQRIAIDLKDQNGDSISTIKTYTMTKKDDGEWYPLGNSNLPMPGANQDVRSFSVCGANFSIAARADVGGYDIVVGNSGAGGWNSNIDLEDFDENGSGYHADGPSEWVLSNNNPYNSDSKLSKIVFKRSVVNLDGHDAKRNESVSEYKMQFNGVYFGGGTSSESLSASRMAMVKGFNEVNNIGYKVNGLNSYDDLGLTDQEVYDLYTYYLTDLYGVEVSCEGGASYEGLKQKSGADDVRELTKWMNGKSCYADLSALKEPENKVYGVTYSESGRHHFGKEITSVDEVLEVLEKLPIENIDTSGSSSNTYEDETDEVQDDCRNSGAGKGLGWFLCNILELAGTAVDGMYNTFIEPALAVDSRFFASGEVSKEQVPYQAWQQFRDIANIFFVILLLVVIFSQLTGFGIDNYGIKRILPKLIVSIILINLSYLICIIVIDASNIIGNGLSALFDSLGNGLKESVMIDGNNVGGVGVVGTVAGKGLVAAGLAYGLATMVGAVWAAGPLILVTLLPAVLGALVAIVFLFFLLSARQAVVVVLVVMSPLAVVCNILPNTKSVFDRYLKIFKLMLLVYPTTSLLVAGGNYVSKLILQVGGGENFYLALTAMVVGIVPIFFIPSMIKDAFAGLGKIGGTLSGLGKVASGKASGVARGNEGFKAIQEKNANSMTRWRAGVDKDGRVMDLTRFGRFWRGGSNVINASRSKYQGIQNAEMLQNELNDDELFAKRLETAEEDRALRASKEMYSNMSRTELASEAGRIHEWIDGKGGYQRAAALTEALVASGQQREVYDMLRAHNFSGSSSIMNSLANSSDKVLKAYGKKAFGKDVGFEDFMNGTGRYTDRVSGRSEDVTLRSYAADKGAAFNSGLDDKALGLISSYSNSNNKIMSTQQLLGAAKTLDSDDALREVGGMLQARSDISFSAEDYTKYDPSIQQIIKNKYNNNEQSVVDSINRAAEAFAGSPTAAANLSGDDRVFFKNIATSMNNPRGGIWTPGNP